MLLSLASPGSPQLGGGTIYLILAINPGLWSDQTALTRCTHYKLKKKKGAQMSQISFVLLVNYWDVISSEESFLRVQSLSRNIFVYCICIFIHIQKFLNKQGIGRGSTNTPAMGRWWADVKPSLALKFSLANRNTMEIFTSLSFLFFGKWTVIKEM